MEELEPIPPAPEAVSRGGKLIKILTALSAFSLILAATGLYMGWKAKKDLFRFEEEINSRPDKAVALKAEVESLEKRLVNVGAETVRIKNQMLSIRDQTQRGFDRLGRELRSAREDLKRRMEESADRDARATSAEKAGSVEGSSASSSRGGTAERPPDGYHIIAPGDNFGKLASRYGRTVEDFLKANPGVDPRRLQIGQKVKIPD